MAQRFSLVSLGRTLTPHYAEHRVSHSLIGELVIGYPMSVAAVRAQSDILKGKYD